ncbi:hypothetical protein D3C85_956590 [compost metagenome]
MGQQVLFAVVALLLLVTACGAQGAELAFAVVVALPGLVVVDADGVIVVGGKGQLAACVVDVRLDRIPAHVRGHFAVGRVVDDVRCIAFLVATAQGQAEFVGQQRAAQVEVGRAAVAVFVVFLQGGVHRHGTAPRAANFLGDDVDHPAHGIGTVQGRHRATNHLDAFDGVDRRHKAALGFAEAVGGDVASGVLALAVDQDQGVGAAHAADADIQAAGLAGVAGNIDPFDVVEGFGQAGNPLLLQLLATDHADAGRRFGNFLFKPGCADDDIF